MDIRTVVTKINEAAIGRKTYKSPEEMAAEWGIAQAVKAQGASAKLDDVVAYLEQVSERTGYFDLEEATCIAEDMLLGESNGNR